MKPEKINTVLIITSMLLMGFGFFYLNSKQAKIAHVKTAVLYDEFEFKRVLEKKLEEVKSQRKNILDSMMLRLEVLSQEIREKKLAEDDSKITVFQQRRNEYLEKEKQFSEDNHALAEKYTSEIWDQLNQYVKDYGNQMGYSYIFGADGSGALMAAEMGRDITEEVKIYVNERFNRIK